MQLQLLEQAAATPTSAEREGWLPVRVELADLPQLKALAWQVQGTDYLTLAEAFDIYERNARHLDLTQMSEQEKLLWRNLQQAFGRRSAHV